jgi:NADPH:quinone reductase-like Zn-dependent oxidoreductase
LRAIVIHRHGGPEVLTFERDWPRPVAGPGEIVVRVKACALNYLDIFVREGMPGEPTNLPQITGGDIAGVVEEVGSGVSSPVIGTRVVLNPSWGCGMCEYCGEQLTPRCLHPHMLGEADAGGLAEYVKCPAHQAIAIPDGYSNAEAACLPITYGTAYRMVVTRAGVRAGDAVLVLGAGGGVAIAAIQLAKLLGARVIATASTDAKLKRGVELGADDIINYVTDEDWDSSVRLLTGKRGADVIIETVGESTWERSIRALGKGGRLVTSGATSAQLARLTSGTCFGESTRFSAATAGRTMSSPRW